MAALAIGQSFFTSHPAGCVDHPRMDTIQAQSSVFQPEVTIGWQAQAPPRCAISGQKNLVTILVTQQP